MMGKVSVIVPTFNNPAQLKRALTSVFKQTYKNIEIIVVNDGSSIDYQPLITELKKDSPFPFFYYYKRNEGPGLARQYGLEQASGVYFQYLDSDDELLPIKIAYQINVFAENEDIVMTYGLSMRNNDPTKIHRRKNKRYEKDNLLKNVLQVRKWHTSSCLWKYNKGQYWEGLFNGEDVLHDFKVAISTDLKILFTNKILSNINSDNPEGGLSEAGRYKKYYARIANDSFVLNTYMLSKLKENGLLKVEYCEPLAERMFYSAIRLSLLGYSKESLELNKLGSGLTNSIIKKMEFRISSFIFKLSIKKRNKFFKKYFFLRRKILSSDIHQYRNI